MGVLCGCMYSTHNNKQSYIRTALLIFWDPPIPRFILQPPLSPHPCQRLPQLVLSQEEPYLQTTTLSSGKGPPFVSILTVCQFNLLYPGEFVEGFEGTFVASLELVDLERKVEHLIFHRRREESAENLGMELGVTGDEAIVCAKKCVSERSDSVMSFSVTKNSPTLDRPSLPMAILFQPSKSSFLRLFPSSQTHEPVSTSMTPFLRLSRR